MSGYNGLGNVHYSWSRHFPYSIDYVHELIGDRLGLRGHSQCDNRRVGVRIAGSRFSSTRLRIHVYYTDMAGSEA